MTSKNLETMVATTVQRLTDFQKEYYSDKKELAKKLNGNLERIYNKVDRLQHRLPHWATLLIAGLFGLCTALIATLMKS